MLVALKFTNRTAGDDGPPCVVEMQVSRNAVPSIMDWYGAFFAGDDYDVRINGRKLSLGINGEFEVPVIDGTPARRAITIKR